jgi:hypothetical protein
MEYRELGRVGEERKGGKRKKEGRRGKKNGEDQG